MRYSVSYCCKRSDPPDGPTSGPDDSDRTCSNERACRKNDNPSIITTLDDSNSGGSSSSGGNSGK